jgi:hypothetical protein
VAVPRQKTAQIVLLAELAVGQALKTVRIFKPRV